MNRYQIPGPRKSIAVASIALTALTIALAVVAPAKVASDVQDLRTVAGFTVTSQAAEVVRDRIYVDVVGTRPAELTAAQARSVLPKRREDG
jgi:hypothetical protein